MKLKRLAALTLVMAMMVVGMNVASATDSTKYFDWDSGAGTITACDADFITTLQEALDAVTDDGVLINENETISSAVTKNDKKLLLNGVSMTITSSGSLTVEEIYTLGSGKITVNAGGTLIIGGTTLIGPGASAVFQLGKGASAVFTCNTTVAKLDVSQDTLQLTALSGAKTSIVLSGNVYLNGSYSGTDSDTIEIASGGSLSVENDVSVDGKMLVNGYLTVVSGKKLTMNTADALTINSNGTLDLGTNGKLSGDGDLGVHGIMRVGYLSQLSTFNSIICSGSIYTYEVSRLVNIWGVASKRVYEYDAYNNSSYYNNSYSDYVAANTPTLEASPSPYTGSGHLVLSSSGFFNHFDPDRSLYAESTRLNIGTDYEVASRGGFAVFTVYESYMQTLSGSVKFTATFTNGTSAACTVDVTSSAAPPEITEDVNVPKTGDGDAVRGLIIVMAMLGIVMLMRRIKAR